MLYGWPFLVARGRRTGYRVLLTPDFLAETGEYGALSEATAGDSPASVTGLAAGDITVAYRTERLTRALAGEGAGGDPGDLILDQHGRPLDLLYGFVCRCPVLLTVDTADFPPARHEALRAYHRFLADETGYQAEVSHPYPLRTSEPVAPPVPAQAAQMPAVRTATAGIPARRRLRRLLPVLLVGLATLSAAAWFSVLGGEDGPVTEVHVEELSKEPVDCTKPVPFRARITVEAPTTVVFHWEADTGNTDSAARRVDFRRPGRHWVDGSVTLTGVRSGQEVEGTQTLVVDQPNTRKAASEYTLRCR